MFHPGELLAQEKAGYGRVRAAVWPAMPEQHRLFYQGLRYFFLAALDEKGFPVATVIQGEPGFLLAREEKLLEVDLAAIKGAPLLPPLIPGSPVGGLGIDFANRRRNRVNGKVAGTAGGRLGIHVEESYGNCPQYIQRRDLPQVVSSCPAETELLESLDADARYLIAATDTLMVASAAQGHEDGDGVDISHRGGLPGFVTLEQGKLRIPDYSGNRYMNTLGNLLTDPRCALLLLDFSQGAALHIQGRAAIDWDTTAVGLTERYWTVEIDKVWRIRQLLPAAGLQVEYANSTIAAG